jgi:hypothetical protein
MSKILEGAMDDKVRQMQKQVDPFGGVEWVPIEAKRPPLSVGMSQDEWLEKTQSMRVVALNEACAIAKANIERNRFMTTSEVLVFAAAFADFLIDGKH